jgi:hypothetical protein
MCPSDNRFQLCSVATRVILIELLDDQLREWVAEMDAVLISREDKLAD